MDAVVQHAMTLGQYGSRYFCVHTVKKHGTYGCCKYTGGMQSRCIYARLAEGIFFAGVAKLRRCCIFAISLKIRRSRLLRLLIRIILINIMRFCNTRAFSGFAVFLPFPSKNMIGIAFALLKLGCDRAEQALQVRRILCIAC
jgi:hypothetical protein